MYGDAGSDMIYGDLGDEFIFGGDGQDSIYGGAGKDSIFGGTDNIYGGDGINSICGDSGMDRIYGGNSLDHIYGGTDDDSIYCGNFWDRLYGGSGNDFIYAGEGLDLIFGGSGNDVIYGGIDDVFVPRIPSTESAQYIYGGSGKDTIYASEVEDIFNSMPNSNEVDTIFNFSLNNINNGGSDRIYLNKLYFPFSWADLIGESFGSLEWYVEANSTGSATHVNHRIICDSDDGRVYFDPDGTGAAVAQHFLNLKLLNLPSDLPDSHYLRQVSFQFMKPTYPFMFEP
jgi:Ca2+-binding RTX toxin-like protein